MSEPSIRLEIADGYAMVTLNRPERLNSFNPEMHQRLRDALDEVGPREDVRAVLLTGAGRAFCAGQDLSERRTAPDAPPPDLGASLDANFNPLVRRLRALPKPVVCAVNGIAAGAGANVALACDIVLAGRSASFIQAFCKLGLLPDSGGTYFLPRLIGTARALGLALLGDRLSAEEAERMGLIWKCVDDVRLVEDSRALARHFATQPTRGLAAIKQAMQASALNSLDQQLDLERDLQRELGRTTDYREGVTAFFEKRSPRFEGR
ncbi:MAG: 2-(1,2-epoxy-1,2-dihydrophenyl)acetyl-CoA isomerase PaaG [Betaproteobacteria bacterium]|jgi:2-(1,2-epoxy-1,2-dihydrophenyl)acetyl-CoA isomerase|nr:2-(1,2-epoxy-1,2-dihydrophenyl)acetyl-CoA isomerase PaaG [Betaproteobacteria bacterium]